MRMRDEHYYSVGHIQLTTTTYPPTDHLPRHFKIRQIIVMKKKNFKVTLKYFVILKAIMAIVTGVI